SWLRCWPVWIFMLHIPATLLTELSTHPPADKGWAAVIADIAAQFNAFHTPARNTPGPVGRQDPAARFAGTVLRRHIQIRDRYCVYLGCRCPARHADLDHTADHAYGGLTTDTNTGP